MSNRLIPFCAAALAALSLVATSARFVQAEGAPPAASASGVITNQSAYGLDETVARLKKDIAAQGITFFQEIDQSALAAKAGITLRPSILLVFGNPPLGTQFITANPQAGLDWPVRMLVYRDETGTVRVAYTDFGWIARRHGVATRDAQFRMASEVAASIAGSVSGR
ncbi:DUF302 domain-containing protein [Reyranella sp.]|uniref:DUF302 domain-containing protein n=1 Tax=Reyranella sp. TaxID=1929291 RepID=UPI003BAC11FB